MRLSKELTPEEIASLKQAVIDFAETAVSFVTANWKAIHDFLDKQAEPDNSDAVASSDDATEAVIGTSFLRSLFEQSGPRKST